MGVAVLLGGHLQATRKLSKELELWEEVFYSCDLPPTVLQLRNHRLVQGACGYSFELRLFFEARIAKTLFLYLLLLVD